MTFFIEKKVAKRLLLQLMQFSLRVEPLFDYAAALCLIFPLDFNDFSIENKAIKCLLLQLFLLNGMLFFFL